MKARRILASMTGAAAFCLLTQSGMAAAPDGPDCSKLPSRADVLGALVAVVGEMRQIPAGLGNDMWATVVNRDGQVCYVTRSGNERGDQWPGSRVISAQKASTANAFSLNNDYPNVAGVGRALSTGNLYGLVLPGGSLFGLQFSNPVDTAVAYGTASSAGTGGASNYGTVDDPLVGRFVGGVNVFGGGLALYDSDGALVGALGVSGDTSCADHIIAWKVRDAVNFDFIPGGVGDGFTNDNLILVNPPTPNTFEHPSCGFGEDPVINGLANTNPTE